MMDDLRQQGPAIGATLRLLGARGKSAVAAPGPWIEEQVAPRPRFLVDNFIRTIHGDPEAWTGVLPPTMFPQWGWPALTRALHGLPYDLTRVVNAGCTWQSLAPLPDDQPLLLRARLERVDDDGRRALFFLSLVTGTPSAPDALRCTLTVFCPLPRKKGEEERPRAERALVPADATEIGRATLPSDLGWRFGQVSGDLNPIHWAPVWAKLLGFGGVILHGFCTAGIAAELIIQRELGGQPLALRGLEARFTQSLRLPADVGVYLGPAVDGRRPLHVGQAPGDPAFLVGAIDV